MDCAVVDKSTGGVEGEAVAQARSELATGGTGLAIIFSHSVSRGIVISPGDGRAFYDGDICEAERKVSDADMIRLGGRRACCAV